MSFSSDVKLELEKNINQSRHCKMAELSAMVSMIGDVYYRKGLPYMLKIATEKSVIARTMARLIWQLFGIVPESMVRRTGKNSRQYLLVIQDSLLIDKMLMTLKLTQDVYSDGIPEKMIHIHGQDMNISRMIIFQPCCKKAFIKGAFMTSGSVSDPNKGYHMEIVCDNNDRAMFVEHIMHELSIDAKIVSRKKYSVVYVKDGEMIVDLLNIMGAHNSLMNMENVRILKDISNNVNRRVNCEVANQHKTAVAYVKQSQDIMYIMENKGMGYLPDNLRELAEARLDAPDASLKELGEMMNPPIGKSGVNHRLRKISEIADKLREC
jgi:hypothetical protein